ncbi:unnamed protein product [Umbelopsis vinacea]
MSNTHLSKRSKQTQAVDPPEFHVPSGPRPDPHASSQPANWFVAMACRIALQIFQWTLTLWTLAKAFSTLIVSKERAWINRSATQWDSIIQDICNTCVWSSELGVQELSVFESSGYLKRRTAHVQNQLSKAFEDWQISNGQATGTSVRPAHSKGFKLSIFAIEDGKAHVAQVAKQMAIAVTEGGRFTSDDINIQLVDKWMTESISEPELAMICYGSAHDYIELNGFLPWHMRLTEFISCTGIPKLSSDLDDEPFNSTRHKELGSN